jgi:hypothetical protein
MFEIAFADDALFFYTHAPDSSATFDHFLSLLPGLGNGISAAQLSTGKNREGLDRLRTVLGRPPLV